MSGPGPVVTRGDIYSPRNELTSGYRPAHERRDYPDGRSVLVFERSADGGPDAFLVWDRHAGTRAGFLWHRAGTIGAALTRFGHGARANAAQRQAFGRAR